MYVPMFLINFYFHKLFDDFFHIFIVFFFLEMIQVFVSLKSVYK
jgi:hypothetical protein